MGFKVMRFDIKRIEIKYKSVNQLSKNIITFECIEILIKYHTVKYDLDRFSFE